MAKPADGPIQYYIADVIMMLQLLDFDVGK